jgi:hypothetical protein
LQFYPVRAYALSAPALQCGCGTSENFGSIVRINEVWHGWFVHGDWLGHGSFAPSVSFVQFFKTVWFQISLVDLDAALAMAEEEVAPSGPPPRKMEKNSIPSGDELSLLSSLRNTF